MRDPVLLQRNYYHTTVDQYDRMHNSSANSHAFALAVLVSMIHLFGIQSILDVGSGTGRALLAIKRFSSGGPPGREMIRAVNRWRTEKK